MKKKPAFTTVGKKAAVVSLQLKGWHMIVIACVLVATVSGAVVLGMFLAPQTGIDRDAVNYPWSPSGDGSSKGEISIPGYDTLTIPANEKTVGLVLPNPSGNPCNFWFKLILKDTGEVLYQSGMIPPGMAVKEITLPRALEVGDYNVEMQIQTASVEDGVPMNGATLQIKLEVR